MHELAYSNISKSKMFTPFFLSFANFSVYSCILPSYFFSEEKSTPI